MKYITSFDTKGSDLNLRNEFRPTEFDQYLMETAERQIKDRDMAYSDILEQRRKAFILSRMSIEMYSGIEAYGKLDVHTWVTEARAANFPRAFELYHKGELIGKAYSIWALVDVDTKKLVRANEYDMSNYPHDEVPEMSIPGRFRIPADLELTRAGSFTVGYSMIDINRHMNNTRYLNVIADLIPGIEYLTMTSLNIRYVHEATYKSDVEVYMSEFTEPGVLDPNADKIIYVKTMTDGDVNVEAVFGFKEN